MNDKINELYNKLDAQDEIIEQLELKVASLEKDKKKAIEYIKSRARKAGVQLMPREKELLEILGDDKNVYECQCCGKEFEDTEPVCPACKSGDVINYTEHNKYRLVRDDNGSVRINGDLYRVEEL